MKTYPIIAKLMIEQLHPLWCPLLGTVTPRAAPFFLSPWVSTEISKAHQVRPSARTYLKRSNLTPLISFASMIEYECPSDIPLRSLGGPRYFGSSQFENIPVAQPKRNCLLTFINSSFQNLSLSSILVDKISEVTPPVRSSIASLSRES